MSKTSNEQFEEDQKILKSAFGGYLKSEKEKDERKERKIKKIVKKRKKIQEEIKLVYIEDGKIEKYSCYRLINLVLIYPDKWEFRALASNPNISLDEFQEYPEIKIDGKIEIDYKIISWDYYEISFNQGILFSRICENLKRYNKRGLSRNINITLNDILKSPGNWDYNDLCQYSKISVPDMVRYFPYCNWNRISYNKNIIIDDVINNINKDWNWYRLSSNYAITLKNILDYPELKWDWDNISLNYSITQKDILNNLDKKWNWKNLSSNPNIDIKFVKDNINKDWDWNILSQNPNITFEDILKNKKLWNWEYVSSNININLNYVLKHPELNWDWDRISENPGLKIKYLMENLDILKDKLNFEILSTNLFVYDIRIIWIKTKKIQYWYRRWLVNKRLKTSNFLKSYLDRDCISIISEYIDKKIDEREQKLEENIPEVLRILKEYEVGTIKQLRRKLINIKTYDNESKNEY